jgi:hypothetical protein
MTDHTAVTTTPQAEAKPTPAAKPPVRPAARKNVELTAAQKRKVKQGLAEGKRPSELAMEIADENRRTVELAQSAIIKGLNTQAAELVRMRERLRQKSAAFDRSIALAVSAKPDAPDWYEHPGPVPRDRVVQCLPGSPSTMTLHRLMERYRKAATKKPRK